MKNNIIASNVDTRSYLSSVFSPVVTVNIGYSLCLTPQYCIPSSIYILRSNIFLFVNQMKQHLLFEVICDRLWEKGHIRAYFQNRVIGTAG